MSYGQNIGDLMEVAHELALIYVKGQQLKGRNPEELLDMYNSALDRILAHYETMQKKSY